MKHLKEKDITIDLKSAPGLLDFLKNQKGFAALTGTKVLDTEFSGDWKLLIKTIVPEAASDTLTLVQATDKVTEIGGVFGQIEAGLDANFAYLQVSFSGLVITIANFEADGTVGTNWDSAQIRLFIIAR